MPGEHGEVFLFLSTGINHATKEAWLLDRTGLPLDRVWRSSMDLLDIQLLYIAPTLISHLTGAQQTARDLPLLHHWCRGRSGSNTHEMLSQAAYTPGWCQGCHGTTIIPTNPSTTASGLKDWGIHLPLVVTRPLVLCWASNPEQHYNTETAQKFHCSQ